MASSSSSIPNMASSSSISGSNPPKYDVFLSFRGKDTRKSFRSHLNKALILSGLVTFVDDRELETGDEISSSLLNAIRSSSLSIIIFSQNYASSSWCLDELLEILECYETRGHIILPIFYHVSPSDVRYQNGTYREAFAKHEKRFKEMQDKVPKWRAALTRLTRVAGLVGWGLKPDDEQKENGTYGEAFAKDEERFKDTRDKVQKWRAALAQVAGLSGLDLMPDDKQLETEVIEKIVKDVLAKLNRISSGDHLDPGLVGIRSRVKTVESLLCLESTDICIIGIWGMGGIGKTTIASAVLKRIANQFDAVCSLENVRNDAINGLNHLQKKLLSGILGEGNHYMNDFTIRRLRCMKILIVIDDVDDSEHLKALVGDRSWFGPGSRIIVTSRDRQVLKNGVDEFKLYEVEGLNDVEALKLYSLNAFKQSHSPGDFMEISKEVVHYAKGNPLALKVLGCSLLGKSMEEWNSLLVKLKICPDSKILRVLRISYDMLDPQEKEIFLFIACFFKGEERDRVTTILNGCGFSALTVISSLIDKCLLTITSDTWLSMHDLIQEMGRHVVFQESDKKPCERSRLWEPQEICDLFKKNTGTEAVQSISLNLSQISELYISSDAFTRMPNLKLLKFYSSTLDNWRYDWRYDWSTDLNDWRYNEWRKEMNKVKIIREELESLPDELRYLCWHGYSLESLPLEFNPEHLVDLEMPYSKLQHLWKDTKFLGKKLRRIDLRECRQLTEVPDLSQAKNLESMELGCCSSLTKFPKISYYGTLTQLVLDGTAIEKVPSLRCLTSLEILYLRGCSNITEFPEISGAITHLYLSGTAIEEVPYSAIKSLSKIVELDISSNTRLKNLPSMRCLTSLKMLFLEGCSNITEFPDVSGAITCLYLSETGIEEVPDSAIKSLSKIFKLEMRSNKKLRNLPSMRHLTSLRRLQLNGCSNITEFPDVSEEIVSLNLSETGIEEVPSFVGRLTNLGYLTLDHCKRLKKVPNCIFQLKLAHEIHLKGCSKLEIFPDVLENEGMLSMLSGLYLSGCPGVKKMLVNVLSSSPSVLCSLERLDLSECKMKVLPRAFSHLSSLHWLNLSGNEFVSLNLELVPSLRSLDINCCKRLRCLQASPHLKFLSARNCTSLKTLRGTNAVSGGKCFFYYYNCFKLDKSTRLKIRTDARLSTRLKDSDSESSFFINESFREVSGAGYCFPGSKIPKWFINQNRTSSIKIDLQPHWYSDKFMHFVVCVVASCKSSNHIGHSYVRCKCKIKDPDCDQQDLTFYFPATLIEHPKSDHVFIKSIMPYSVFVDRKSDGECFKMTDGRFNTENSFSWQKARFRFSTSDSCCKVKKCGINLLYSEWEEEEDCYSEWEDDVREAIMMCLQRKVAT